jgi:hypothetical protein
MTRFAGSPANQLVSVPLATAGQLGTLPTWQEPDTGELMDDAHASPPEKPPPPMCGLFGSLTARANEASQSLRLTRWRLQNASHELALLQRPAAIMDPRDLRDLRLTLHEIDSLPEATS